VPKRPNHMGCLSSMTIVCLGELCTWSALINKHKCPHFSSVGALLNIKTSSNCLPLFFLFVRPVRYEWDFLCVEVVDNFNGYL
jgi:hypothetical protein